MTSFFAFRALSPPVLQPTSRNKGTNDCRINNLSADLMFAVTHFKSFRVSSLQNQLQDAFLQSHLSFCSVQNYITASVTAAAFTSLSQSLSFLDTFLSLSLSLSVSLSFLPSGRIYSRIIEPPTDWRRRTASHLLALLALGDLGAPHMHQWFSSHCFWEDIIHKRVCLSNWFVPIPNNVLGPSWEFAISDRCLSDPLRK